MSNVDFENYFPFTDGLGAGATSTRWRLMARNWVQGGSGILQGYLQNCAPSLSGGTTVNIQPGAVWIDGFYGENTSPKAVTVSTNGMVVARMDPSNEKISFFFVAAQNAPTQNPAGIFELPIAQITGGVLTDIRQFIVTTASTAIPTGIMVPWAGAANAVPTGWLYCDGRAVGRQTYPALFALLNAANLPYGTGDGSTTFNIPDTRSRVFVGAAATSPNGTARSLGTTGGAETHTLSIWEIPSHTHSGASVPGIAGPAPAGWLAYKNDAAANGLVSNGPEKITFTTGVNISAAGGGQAMSLVPPFIAINYMIRA
jgi:microcystin-dependent protein